MAGPTLAVAAGMLGVMVLLPKIAPRVPAPLAAVASGIGASGLRACWSLAPSA